MKPSASRCTAFRALPWLARANFVGLCAAVAAFAALLWPVWLHDDNLTHGFFLPILSGILIVESRRDPNPRFVDPAAGAAVACLALCLLSLAAVAVAVIYAAALGWSFTMAEFMLSVALVLILASAWLAFADGRSRFLSLNWAAAVAILVWLFASPPPPGTYARLAFFLQTEVTRGVVRAMGLLGIAAYRDGNVIELARTSVGVSEACSGVRSLISCTVAGLVLSALVVRRPLHRGLVVVLSPAIGLFMNLVRSLLLTLLANAGVNIEGRWHDLTGASIIVGTTLIMAALAFWLRGREPLATEGHGDSPATAPRRSPLQAIVACALLVAVATGILLVAVGSSPPAASAPEPDLAAFLPSPPQGWTAQSTPDMDRYSGTLHTHDLVERVYSAGPARGGAKVSLYLAYWRPGEAPVSLVDAHTPDACWPGTGWVAEPVPAERTTLALGGSALPPAECRLFKLNGFQTYVWFWHLRGGRTLTIVDPHSATRLLRLALRYGFRREEDQLFVRVSSNRPWEEIAAQPLVPQFFANLRPLGL